MCREQEIDEHSREGVTDLGKTTMPLLASQESRTVASWTLYFSAIFLSSGSACSGESGHVSGGARECSDRARGTGSVLGLGHSQVV